MTWLLPPQLRSTSSAFVPALACSTKACAPDLNTSDSLRAFWLTLSGKATQRPLSWPGWKTRAWSPRLFGAAIWNDSTAASLLVAWMASLPASPASHGASPVPSKAQTMRDGSSPPSSTSFAERERGSWCSRTSPDLFRAAGSIPFSGRWPKNGSMRSGCLYERPKWAPAISGSACSSRVSAEISGTGSVWATPDCNSSTYSNGHMGMNIREQASLWKTPHGFQAGNGPDGNEFSKSVRQWATPRSSPNENRTTKIAPSHGNGHGLVLAGQAASWPTPDALAINDGEEPSSFLARQQRQKAKGINGNGMGMPLAMAAKTWPTATARDYRGGGGIAMTRSDGKSRMDMLDWRAESYSPSGPVTADGETSSPVAPGSRRRLNPAFVCWLMGWPWWWTRPVPISFAAAEMESYRSGLRSRLSSLVDG